MSMDHAHGPHDSTPSPVIKGSFFSSGGSLAGSTPKAPEPVTKKSAPGPADFSAPVMGATASSGVATTYSGGPAASSFASPTPDYIDRSGKPSASGAAPVSYGSAGSAGAKREPVKPASVASGSVRSTPRTTPVYRISAIRELKLLLRQGVLVLFGERRNLIISLLFPFIAAAVTVWIAGEDMFSTFEATKSACFILVCAAIWGGLFNSIQSLVKERENIKRDYVSGALRIGCYMGSRAIIQFVLCVIQSIVLSLSIPMIEVVHGNSMPSSGLLGGPVMLEFFVSLFLVMYASDALGLLISSIVKKEELASKLAPYILIVQLLFSGVLFKLEGAANALSGIMISRWGMEALGSICDLNNTQTTVYTVLEEGGYRPGECYCGVLESLEFPESVDSFKATGEHFVLVLCVMILFVVVPLIAGNAMLHRVKNDGRE